MIKQILLKTSLFLVFLTVLAALLAWYSFWLATPINLATADIGRHIVNGRLIVSDFISHGKAILFTNAYSYTHPDYPFLNHHWLSGVIFYFVHHFWSFKGLQIFYIIVSLVTFAFFFSLAKRQANLFYATLVAIPLIPLIASRSEARPEVFSYLFIGIFIYLLALCQKKKLPKSILWLLPLIQLIWINAHIYAIFGPFIIFAFILERLFTAFVLGKTSLSAIRHYLHPHLAVFITTILVTLISPHTYKSLLYPLIIFKNYGYTIAENQSIWFLENWGQQNPNFLIVKIITALLILSFITLLITRRQLPVADIILTATFTTLAWLAIRNFTIFGLVTLPILAANLKQIPWPVPSLDPLRKFLSIVTILLLVSAGTYFYYYTPIRQHSKIMGLGLYPNINKAANFIRDNNIQGPIFNNYDIGGYLIYNLYPDWKVFVDNRPEAYPKSFFQEVYIPMQEDEQVWQQQLATYNFNAIVFWRHDLTNWGQQFLEKIVKDKEWVPVFVDAYNIIFVRQQDNNQSIIDQFGIPRSVFSVGPAQ